MSTTPDDDDLYDGRVKTQAKKKKCDNAMHSVLINVRLLYEVYYITDKR